MTWRDQTCVAVFRGKGPKHALDLHDDRSRCIAIREPSPIANLGTLLKRA